MFARSAVPAFYADSIHEDVDAAFFDADGDRDQDLVVVSGGNEFDEGRPALRQRLYLNDGRGNFVSQPSALPPILENASCVAPGDFDGDGDIDLFIGGRVVPRKYGTSPNSHLLLNEGGGRFSDVTSGVATELLTAGMVTDAAWLDYDRDGSLDLVLVGEWMPIRIFSRAGGKFVERTHAAGLGGTEGWWNSVTVADVNGDSQQDLVLGNLGLNSFITASAREPARLYVHDFGGNGVVESILTIYRHGQETVVHGRDELFRAIPQLREKFPTYAAYGAARFEDVLPATERRGARVLEAHTFASSIALNQGNGTFSLRPMPVQAQFAPVYAAALHDFDGDDRGDIMLGGNLFGVPPWRGRYDAGNLEVLRGSGNGAFTALDLAASGLILDGQVRAIERLRGPRGEILIAIARNNDRMQIVRPTRLPRRTSP